VFFGWGKLKVSQGDVRDFNSFGVVGGIMLLWIDEI
jgi:hypothetical protein